jgi:hypothetical protein
MPHTSDPDRFFGNAGPRGRERLVGQRDFLESLVGEDIMIDGALSNNGFYADLTDGEVPGYGGKIFLRENYFPAGQTFPVRGLAQERGRDVRNARTMAARTNLPHGPESIVASYLSGIESKNAAQQDDILREQAGVEGPAPNRKGYSGGKTRRHHRSRKSLKKRRYYK